LLFRIKLLFTPFKEVISEKRNSQITNYTEVNKYELIVLIKKSVKRAAKYSIWRNKCLEQALTARVMLTKRNIKSKLYFGVNKNNNKLKAHAWLKVEDFFVTGEKGYKNFTVVACYD